MAKIEKQSNYCRDCKLRAKVSEEKDSDSIDLNEVGFCSIGYTLNPRTEAATFNVAINHGVWSICARNPWRRKALIRMGLADIDNPFDYVKID
jgi:hypothetical protein